VESDVHKAHDALEKIASAEGLQYIWNVKHIGSIHKWPKTKKTLLFLFRFYQVHGIVINS